MVELQKHSCLSWFYLVVASVVQFFTIGFLDAYGVFLVFLVDHYNEENSKAGWIGSLAFFCTYFLYPFTSRIRQKLGTRTIVLFAGALVVPTFFLTPLMPTMNLLFLTFSIPYGITCSIIYCAVFTTILEYFDRRRATAFGVVIGCNALGTTMYSFFLPVLMNRVGWKETSWILTGMSFICVIFALVYRKPESRRQCSVNGEDVEVKLNGKKMEVNLKECTLEDEDDHLRTYCQLLKNKRFLMSLISFVSFTSVALMPSVFMVRFATNLGYPISKAKWLMIARSIICVVTRFSIGHILDIAVKHKKISHIAFLDITLFSLSTLLCSLTTSFPLLMLYMAFVAVMDSIYWIIEPLLASEVTDGINPDKGFALFNCIGSFALLGGPPSLGWLYDTTRNFNHVFYATSAVSTMAACFMALGLCLPSSHAPFSPAKEDTTDNRNKVFPGLRGAVVRGDDDIGPQQVQYITAV